MAKLTHVLSVAAISLLTLSQSAEGQGKKAPVAEPERVIEQLLLLTPACAEELAACLANDKRPPAAEAEAAGSTAQTATSWYAEVKSCAPSVLRAPQCFSPAVAPSEILKMRQEVTALVAATTGADCAVKPSGERNPLCLPAAAAAAPASAPAASMLRQIDELVEISCEAKSLICLVLLVRDGTGRQVLLADKQKQMVFVDPARDRYCVVHKLEDAQTLPSCVLKQLPFVREKGLAKMKIAKT